MSKKTIDQINSLFTYTSDEFRVIARTKLNDGETLSIQASSGHYCTPRDIVGPYIDLEVGFPSVSPNHSWRDYYEGDWENDNHKSSVYCYVPIELIAEFIEDHGGIKTE